MPPLIYQQDIKRNSAEWYISINSVINELMNCREFTEINYRMNDVSPNMNEILDN